jgi:hypothetical protein
MPRIIVTADSAEDRDGWTRREQASVLLDERVDSIHLCDDHAAEQLIQRLAWAVTDAEEAELAR